MIEIILTITLFLFFIKVQGDMHFNIEEGGNKYIEYIKIFIKKERDLIIEPFVTSIIFVYSTSYIIGEYGIKWIIPCIFINFTIFVYLKTHTSSVLIIGGTISAVMVIATMIPSIMMN